MMVAETRTEPTIAQHPGRCYHCKEQIFRLDHVRKVQGGYVHVGCSFEAELDLVAFLEPWLKLEHSWELGIVDIEGFRDRFLENMVREELEDGDGCWPWVGLLWFDGREIDPAKLVAHLLAGGDRGEISHANRCGNHNCVRPGHLRVWVEEDKVEVAA